MVDALRLGLISDDDLRRADPLSLAVESASMINVDLTGAAIIIAGGVCAGLILGGCYWAVRWTRRWSRRAVERDLEAGGGRGEHSEEVEEVEFEANIGMAAMAGMAGVVARPAGEDALESTIEFTEGGGIVANGLPLR